jgi:hypothetical protein
MDGKNHRWIIDFPLREWADNTSAFCSERPKFVSHGLPFPKNGGRYGKKEPFLSITRIPVVYSMNHMHQTFSFFRVIKKDGHYALMPEFEQLWEFEVEFDTDADFGENE